MPIIFMEFSLTFKKCLTLSTTIFYLRQNIHGLAIN